MSSHTAPQYTALVPRRHIMLPDASGSARRLNDFRVGEWLAEPALCRLSRGEECIRLRPQLMDLLVCLAWRAGHVVSRDEIFREVWPGQFVAESGLARCVTELRQALHDSVREPRFIETIAKRGYRLIAPVTFPGLETGMRRGRQATHVRRRRDGRRAHGRHAGNERHDNEQARRKHGSLLRERALRPLHEWTPRPPASCYPRLR